MKIDLYINEQFESAIKKAICKLNIIKERKDVIINYNRHIFSIGYNGTFIRFDKTVGLCCNAMLSTLEDFPCFRSGNGYWWLYGKDENDTATFLDLMFYEYCFINGREEYKNSIFPIPYNIFKMYDVNNERWKLLDFCIEYLTNALTYRSINVTWIDHE